MPNKDKKAAKKSDDRAKKKDKGELDMDQLDNVSGGYTPGGSSIKRPGPKHHREGR